MAKEGQLHAIFHSLAVELADVLDRFVVALHRVWVQFWWLFRVVICSVNVAKSTRITSDSDWHLVWLRLLRLLSLLDLKLPSFFNLTGESILSVFQSLCTIEWEYGLMAYFQIPVHLR